MTASGSYLASTVAARPMAPAVSRTVGSAITLFIGRPCRFSRTRSAYPAFVSTRMLRDVENGDKPLETPVQKRLAIQELQHLLGTLLAAERPEPLARSPRHDHRIIHLPVLP